MDVPGQAYIAIGAVLAAFVAGLFSLINLILSKEQKISEFRQAWIDNLRDDISNIVTYTYHMNHVNKKILEQQGRKSNDIEKKDLSEALRDSYDGYMKALVKILLRVNPNDPDVNLNKVNSGFLDTVSAIRNNARDEHYEEASNNARKLIDLSKPVLKLEWERVKSGERAYRFAKYASILAIFLSIILMMGIAGALIFIPYKSYLTG